MQNLKLDCGGTKILQLPISNVSIMSKPERFLNDSKVTQPLDGNFLRGPRRLVPDAPGKDYILNSTFSAGCLTCTPCLQIEGLGLGLALVLGFVDILDGQLGVSTNSKAQPRVPTGSIFWFEVPLRASPSGPTFRSEEKLRKSSPPAPVCVLCVSPSKLVREMLKNNLEAEPGTGWEIIVGSSVDDVLDGSGYKQQEWSAVVVVTQRLEDYAALNGRVETSLREFRWLLLTKQERKKPNGFFGVLEQPVRRESLVQAVIGASKDALLAREPPLVASRRTSVDPESRRRGSNIPRLSSLDSKLPSARTSHRMSGRAGEPDSDQATLRPLPSVGEGAERSLTPHAEVVGKEESKRHDVLLVDDTAVTQMLGKQVLSSAGFAVEVAGNGLQAVEKWREKEYDVVLMDIEMEVSTANADADLAARKVATRLPECGQAYPKTKSEFLAVQTGQ